MNRELIMLDYNIGKVINEHKSWGNKFIDNLATDIKIAFPEVKGYSVRNLKYMAKFAAMMNLCRQCLQQIPWSHNTLILDKVQSTEQREWYIRKTAENGWSHSVLTHQIESGLYERQVIAEKISNFENRLPSPQSELAVQTMKDPYVFDIIPFREDMVERDIENALVSFIKGNRATTFNNQRIPLQVCRYCGGEIKDSDCLFTAKTIELRRKNGFWTCEDFSEDIALKKEEK